MNALVAIVMGSASDRSHADRIAAAARGFGLDVEMRISSAHKTPLALLEILESWERDPRPKVIITVAGRSNALSGFADAAVSVPVIACPPPSDAFSGADVFSSLRMPSGVAPMLVLDPANAALAAAKILGVADPEIRRRVAAWKKGQVEKIEADDTSLRGERFNGDGNAVPGKEC
ncbi:MAG: AIR carboxylase family protein [Rectinema sp.]